MPTPVSRIDRKGQVTPFVTQGLSRPAGIAVDRHNGDVYIANCRGNSVVKIDRKGVVSVFATISDQGLGYLCFKNDRFYVTAFWSHAIYEVAMNGSARRVLGNGERGIVDGAGDEARLSFPAGIACHPWAPRLYVNE
ncbi:MAG: hypothetical protein ABW171_02115, partial [Steroidobacter sp.]